MHEKQTAAIASAPPFETDLMKLNQDLDSAARILQALLDREEGTALEAARFIPPILNQAQEAIRAAEARLLQSETQHIEAQQNAKHLNELQTLLDILPVGILVSHDPDHLNMTTNSAGLRMLNLDAGSNPSKSALEGDQLPFKVFRGGQEVPPEELPMQYAASHRVAVKDIELDIQQSDGTLLNLLEYASPLYDEQGAVRGSLGVFVDITARKSIERRLAMHYAIARVLAEAKSTNGATNQVLRLICETAGWEYGALWRVEADSNRLTNVGIWRAKDANLSEFGESIQYSILQRAETSLPGYVLRSGESLWLSDIKDFPSEDALIADQAGLRSAFVLPVRSGNRVIAILECLSIRRQIQDQNLTTMLNAVCNQMGIFLERKLLEEALSLQTTEQRLLVQAGLALSSSLDYEEQLKAILSLVVPDLADWCAIDIVDYDNILRRVAAAHVDPDKEKLVYQNQPTRPIDPHAPVNPQFETLATGKSLLYPTITPAIIEQFIVDPVQLEIIRQLKPISSISVPLTAHGRILGLCTFVQSVSGRHYDPSDLELAEGIARQAGLALDNGLLYADSKKINADLERRVEDRTSQLNIAIQHLKNQMAERLAAENQVKILNAELEQRIAERTSQLEVANRDLQKEVVDRQQASRMLQDLLQRTSELYRISQSIGIVRTPNEVLSVLLTSRYLKDASRASIAILDAPWKQDGPPPAGCFILAEWNKGRTQPGFLGQHFTLEEYGLVSPVPFGKPVVIKDIQSVEEISENARQRFADLSTHSLIILPLIAGGEWYGLLSLHNKTRRMTDLDDLMHVRGLVDETAIVIKNMRLLETESQARQEAERANELKLKFLGMISHELRTPLTSIKGFATTLLADDVVWAAEKQRDFLETINRESDKLHDLIEQLLDLSRMEAGILRVFQERLSMNEVMESAMAQLQALTSDHELIVEIPPDLPFIFGDGSRIAQVLTNLVSNAARYSPSGAKITISVYHSGEMVQINVADHGPGIPPQDRERVFEAFRQLENGTGNRTKGAGLGLAICKGLIEAQNGRFGSRIGSLPAR